MRSIELIAWTRRDCYTTENQAVTRCSLARAATYSAVVAANTANGGFNGHATLVVVSGWASSGDSSELDANRRPISALGPGFFDPAAPPHPEGMIRPRPGSWDAVRPSRGYRVVLLTAGNDQPTTTLVTAVTQG